MRYDQLSDDLRNASFEFFYWYSRFEFVLKENGFLKYEELDAKAEPSWKKFREKYEEEYRASKEENLLVKLHPKRQVVSASNQLDWKPVGISHCNSDLCCVITMLSTIRNNLFHGGKHGDMEVDDIDRNISLLSFGKQVLDQLAEQFGYEADYKRYY
ncbi:hypothetical protein [Neptuniibacter sp. CAU 1671]|uniref:hypothetical protein n=1 Tax=Neptuniibacter sp. CAU 1671 TaxID=3032593 RepID=UPI0023DA5DB0|nr:hypothetical protein [Neptuniibacter sp. CAU 1671]MDF2183118.1 hypothetical protein [Neptuniibacter sp. CAU 1671]